MKQADSFLPNRALDRFFWILFFLSLFAIQCSKHDPTSGTIDPAKNPNLLGKALLISNATNKPGTPPAPSTSASAPVVSNSQSAASVTANSRINIPIEFTSAANVTGMYIYVNSSDNYWDIPLNFGVIAGQMMIPVGIPSNILSGSFVLKYNLYSSSGLVGPTINLTVTIIDLNTTCSGQVSESGHQGITVRSYNLPTSGTVSVTYNMYTLPDRMDIFVDGVWVTGTGPALTSGDTPPPSTCISVSPGYISGVGVKTFAYTAGKRIDIYMSGCYGGTDWDYSFGCPGSTAAASTGNCSLTFKGASYSMPNAGCGTTNGIQALASVGNISSGYPLLSLSKGAGPDFIAFYLTSNGTNDFYSNGFPGSTGTITVSGKEWTFSGTLKNSVGDSGAISGTCTCNN